MKEEIHVFILAKYIDGRQRWFHKIIPSMADLHNALVPYKQSGTYMKHKITRLK